MHRSETRVKRLRKLLFLAAGTVILLETAPQALSSETKGSAWRGEPGVRATSTELKALEQARGSKPRLPVMRPRQGRLESGGTGNNSGPSGSPTPTPLAPQVVNSNLNFTAATFYDCQTWPPDTMGAAGPSQFIIALNGRVRSFDKATGTTDGAIDVDSDAFFSPVATPGFSPTTDPHIRYDRLSGRWFVTMIDVPGGQATLPNRILIAVSDAGVITSATVWTFYQFEHDVVGATPNADTGNFADFPTLGIDANALYIGVNVFTGSGGFVNTTAFVVQKSSLLTGGPVQVTAFRELISGAAGPFTPQGVDNYDPAATEGYFIGINSSGTSQLILRRVTNPGSSSPSLSGNVIINVPPWHAPINVTAQGTPGSVDGGDARLLAAHLRSGSLWTTHNVGVNSTGGTRNPNRNGVRWYQLAGIPSGQAPSVVQSGTVYEPGSSGDLSYWMGTVMVSGQGHAAMGFSAAGPTNYIDAMTTGRLAGDPSGTMETPVAFTASGDSYNPTDNVDPHRWGDFSFTSLDPSDDMTMWTVQEWCLSGGDGYAVQVAQLLAPPPAMPTTCTPATVAQGMAAVTVTLDGSTAGGAGFYDPGPGFSNRLALRIEGGGVTVTNLTYNSPSNLTAVLTVATNAVPGARAITVVNPDGQSATSATGLLAITALPTNRPPVLAPIPDQAVYALALLTVTNSATDPDAGQTLTFSLDPGTPAGASIDPTNGIFTWTPAPSNTGTTNITVRVTDNGLPPLTAARTFKVTVAPWPTLSPGKLTGNGLTFSWTTLSGKTYQLQSTASLANPAWAAAGPAVTAVGATASATVTNVNRTVFYLLVVEP